MDFQTFLVYTFLMTFCVGAGYMLALCPINKDQSRRQSWKKIGYYQAIVFSIILVYVVIVGFRYKVVVVIKTI